MSTLVEILRDKLIPWSRHNAAERFIVARSKMHVLDMPDDVRLVRHKITGKRVTVKGRRYYHNTRSVVAQWPEMGLNEVGKSKLVCVINGHINYQLGNYKVKCGAGNFIFISPGTPHPDGTKSYVDREKSTFCDLLFFQLHPNAIECWNSHYDEDGRVSADKYLILQESITLVFRALMKEVMESQKNAFLVVEQLLSTFIIILLREANAGRVQIIRGNYADEDQTSQADFETQLRHYVQSNLHKQLPLETVARDMFMSRAHFTRTVRRETGQSFNEILASYRMEESKKLLRDSEWTISTIATFVGFKSPSYFRTFFKRHSGKTPSEFRDSHRTLQKSKISDI